METFAYLQLAQDYEDPEPKEFVALQPSWLDCVRTLRSSRTGIALLSLLCTAPSWVSAASATTYGVYPGGFVSIRPDGDQGAVVQPGTCTVLPNPCSGYRPLLPNRPVYPVRPIYPPVYPDPDYRPLRPSDSVFLRRGDTGENVRYVQDLLRAAGYFDAASTGFYATLTESGVKAFQRDYGLPVDGIVGIETLSALEG